MSKPSGYERDDYRVGDFWLSRRPGSLHWYRTWLDGRQTRRAALDTAGLAIDTTNVEEARALLKAWFIETNRPKDAKPADVALSVVTSDYLADKATMASIEQATIAINRFTKFWPGYTIGQITIQEQDRYIAARRKEGIDDSSTARELGVLRAALRNSVKKGELNSVPFIKYIETADDLRNDAPKGRPVSMPEMAALFNAAKSDRVRRYLMIQCCTLARPGAGLELRKAQCDFEHSLVHLNPPGRRQNKKYRPTVPMAKALRPWLAGFDGERFMAYGAREVETAKNIWRRLRADAKLGDDVNGYSLRHTMARELRKRRVPAEQIELMLGHARPDSTTQIYAPYSPDYMQEAVAAIDAYMAELQKLVTWPIVRPMVALVEKMA